MSHPRPLRDYKVVKFRRGNRSGWFVVSESLREDTTWDVIKTCKTRDAALAYVDEVRGRTRSLVEAGLP